MKATKIYGNAIYLNNEKVTLSNKAISVLNYDSSVFDGSMSSRVISALELVAGSKSDLEVIAAAEKSEIVEINKTVKGFNFKGFAVLSSGVCFYVFAERDGRPMFFEGEKAQAGYNQIMNSY